MMGENQFDSPETRDANILSYEKTNKSLKISDNIFMGLLIIAVMLSLLSRIIELTFIKGSI